MEILKSLMVQMQKIQKDQNQLKRRCLLAEIQSPAKNMLDINDVVFEKSNNRRYTMSDIGDLKEN